MKKKIVSMLLSSVMIISSLAACTNNNGGEGAGSGAAPGGSVAPGTGGETPTPGTGEVNEETGVYEVKDLYITVDGTLTANVDNGQDAFIQQWEEAVGAKLGHEVKLHINQPDHSGYASNVAQMLATGQPGDGSYPDALIMSAGMFRQYANEGLLWDMANAYDNAEFQARVTLPSVNLNMRDAQGHQYGFAPTYGNGCVTYIKQSWLDAAGKKIDDIKTFDDYYALLKDFTKDGQTGVIAAGFGKLDEAPFINYMPECWQGA